MSNILKFDAGGSAERKVATDLALDRLKALVTDDLAAVNEVILHRLQSQVALIPELAGHLIASGGKRLRPLMTLATTKLVGYEGKRQCRLAACVEFIHTATLLHDDVVDGSGLRRGSDTANVIWGNKPSVLVGDFVFSRAFELMVEDGSLKILKILSQASSIIAEGEVLQLITSNNPESSEEAYLKVIEAKTAALFAAACQISAVIAERPVAEEDALVSFGRNFGMAFQLTDDALDYSARQITLGKAIGDDFRDCKITLPVLLAYRRGNDDGKNFWRRVVGKGVQRDGDLEKAMALMNEHNALTDTVDRARHYGSMAKDALAIFPRSEAKTALLDITDFCIDRAY